LYDELVSAIADEASGAGTDIHLDVSAIRRVMACTDDAASVAPLQFPEAVALVGPKGRVPEAALRADLSYFVRRLGRPIALLIDEAQLVANDGRALSVLRFLATRVDGLILVLAGTSGLINRIRDVHSPILRQFREIEVRAFIEWEDVQTCVQRPLYTAGIFGGVPGSLISSLRQLTDGNPYEIQLYCHEMFARWQQGISDGMKLTPEVLEGIRSRMESGRNVLDRPLIRAVRAMKRKELIAFNILTSALGNATPDEAWFAYCLPGQPEITRTEYDQFAAKLVAQGILTLEGTIRFAEQTELFDEVYARLWTARTLGSQQHAQVTSRGDVRAMLANRICYLLHGFARRPVRIFQTCCPLMNRRHMETMIRALDKLPVTGPDDISRVSYLHSAILRSGEPAALDLTTVTCTYGDHTIERWLYSADEHDVSVADTAEFKAAAERVAQLGGRLTASRVRLPLRTWPARDWFQKATGELRNELAANHYIAAFNAYEAGDLSAAYRNFQASFDLKAGWSSANSLTYLSLASDLKEDALEWSKRALELANNAYQQTLSHYNAAMAYLLADAPGTAREHLTKAVAASGNLALIDRLAFLLVPDPDDITRLREETDVDLVEAVARARASLGIACAEAPVDPNKEAADQASVTARTQKGRHHSTPPRRKPVVLSVATEWTSSHGGLSTFNRHLCQALAAAGSRVYCLVLNATAAEITAADEAGVTLLPVPEMPGASEDMRLTSRPKQLGGAVPDLVLGHGRITGHAAQRLVENFFPTARRLHFIHMAPDEIEWYKPGLGNDLGLRAEERTTIERALGSTAHRVVTVGPRLHEQFLDEFRHPDGLPPLRIDPGFDHAVPSADLSPPQGSPLRVMLLGRIEDAELKGVDLAAAACGRVATWMHEDGLRGVRLLVRGAPAPVVDDHRNKIVRWAGNPLLDVVVRSYTSAQPRIDEDLRTASLVIMPSRREGFGLVGLEAITQGVPVLISSESGLADLLRETLGHEQASRFVVELSRDDEKDTEKWARAIDRKLRDCDGAFQQAARLRSNMAERVSWRNTAEALLGEVSPQ
jgi:glycosyltransferase involved in cell wall biosynthesis